MRALIVALALLLALPASAAPIGGSGKLGAKARIAFVGDSITYGAGYATTPFPERIEALYGATYCDAVNLGVSGAQAAAIATQYATSVAGQRYAWLVVLGGINDIVALNADGTATFNTLNAMVTTALAAGYRVAWITILPFHGYGGWNASRQTELEEFNALVAARGGITVIDGYVGLGDPGGLGATYMPAAYTPDGLHLDDDGAAALAALVKAGLNP